MGVVGSVTNRETCSKMPLVEVTPTKLLTELQLAREESDRLFQILRPEALYERPIAQRHRVVFYIGHLDGFDAIQISREGAHQPSPDPELDALFQAGIDPGSANLPKDKQSEWPTMGGITFFV